MKLFQILSSSKVYFILPWQTFFQKYFDPHSFWQLSTEHVDALQTPKSKEKRKRESWKSRKQRESKFSHMLMTLCCGKCVSRTHVLFTNERVNERRERRKTEKNAWRFASKDAKREITWCRGQKWSCRTIFKKCHKRSIEIRDCKIQPSRYRARVQRTDDVTVFWYTRLLF